MNILVIGDAHCKPSISNRRFDWLGSLLVDLAPDVVVDMGDWADMESLSSYDGSTLTGATKKTKSFEGRNYKRDVEVAVEARDRIHRKLQSAGRKRPRRIALGGNHDDERLRRAVNLVPELSGVVTPKDFQHDSYSWEYIPFGEACTVGGFEFKHYFTSGLMGKPTGGEYPAANLLKTQYRSCIAGHSHLFNESHRTSNGGKRIQAFVAGCYLDPTQVEAYAGPANSMWSKGLLYLRDVDDGVATGGYDWLTIDRIRREYGR